MNNSSLPADRGHLRTEHRHESSKNFDALNIKHCVELMIEDHRCVYDAVHDSRNQISEFIGNLVQHMREGGRLIYIGAGTSGRLGVLDASECPPTFQSDPEQVIGIIAGGDTSLRRSSESREDDPCGAHDTLLELSLQAHDTVLGIAAGGTTPYVLGAIQYAKQCGARTGLLTCVPLAEQIPDCDHVICLNTGPELLTGSTRLKAGSATKLVLNIITTTTFVQLGKVYSNLMVDLRATNDKLTDRALRILMELCPGLMRQEAAELLEQAHMQLKTAIAMFHRKIDFGEAELLLKKHDGQLRPIIEES